jgi:hypothetical protein
LRARSAAVLASSASPLVSSRSGVGEGADDEDGFVVGAVAGVNMERPQRASEDERR